MTPSRMSGTPTRPASFNRTTTLPPLQPESRAVPRGWWAVFAGALLISVYALGYVVLGDRLYPPNLADSFRARPWGIYTHAFAAMLALGVGAFQFRTGLRARRPRLHRVLGRIYVPAAIVTGASGLYMAAYSYGGTITHLGFGLLGAGVILTTSIGFARIRARDTATHREWMIRSYALIFAAVTLRILLPLLIIAYAGNFDPAYRWVSWLSWVPNIIWAEWYIARMRRRPVRPASAPPAPPERTSASRARPRSAPSPSP